MRRNLAGVGMALAFVLLPARPAEAQGFWRWLETLSGPELQGPGFEIAGLCRGVFAAKGPEATWGVSPYCVDVARDRIWVAVGVQVYALAGDNTETADPHDRVDALGVLPTVDVMWPRGFGVGGGLGARRYATPAGTFTKADVEAWLKWRPFRARGAAPAATALVSRDWLELRLGFVFHSAFEAGRFGPGSPRLDAEVSPVLVIAINLIGR